MAKGGRAVRYSHCVSSDYVDGVVILSPGWPHTSVEINISLSLAQECVYTQYRLLAGEGLVLPSNGTVRLQS